MVSHRSPFGSNQGQGAANPRAPGVPPEAQGGNGEPSNSPQPPGSAPVAPELRREILQKLLSGFTARGLALQYGVHKSTILRWRRSEQGEPLATPSQAAPAPLPRAQVDSSPAELRDTGRYSQDFKREVLAQVASGRRVSEVARQYRMPEGVLYHWRRTAKEAGGELPPPQSTRPPINASPIDEAQRSLVLSLKGEHPNMGLAQIQNQLKRFHALKVSRHVIGRIFAEAGIPLQKRSPQEGESDPAKNRFEMSRPNELWAVDFKELWIHSEKAHALFVLDDFSRFSLAFALTQEPTAELAIQTLNEAIQRYGRPERVLSDRGPQFHAWNGVSKFDEFLADFFVDHTVTKAGHPFTNGKLESFNRSLESEVLDVEEFASLKEAQEKIRAYVTRYNFFRTHLGIDGLCPADRYFGMVQEARRALEEGLQRPGPGLTWLRGILSQDGPGRREPSVLQLLIHDGKLELVVLGRRFSLG
jgi:putative transposase